MSAYLAASMIQNVTQNRANKQLQNKDFKNIAYASCLNFFHTNSMFSPFPFGVYYGLTCFWVKRIDSNTYQCQRNYITSLYGNLANAYSNIYQPQTWSATRVKNELGTDLLCDKDEDERVVVMSSYRFANSIREAKNKLGFFILTPKTRDMLHTGNVILFYYKVVFTPKPGLFPVKVE